jgi:hypothetical protein
VPDLDFRVEGVEVLEFAAVPTLRFRLRLANLQGETVSSVALHTQIRIAAAQRHYNAAEQTRLQELFGEPRRWRDTLKSLLWTHTVVLVPPFSGSTVVDMPVACTYDFEVVSAKYFHALEDGEVPLELLFSGTVFYRTADGLLQIAPIPWEKEASFRLPVRLWKQLMAHYFPNSAWLRLRQDVFDRLYEYRVRHGLPTWEAALESLLHASEGEVAP